MTGAGSRLLPFLKRCAVLSGGMTALLPTPGTGVCNPNAARRRDTDRRRRQVTKLPRPIPQYLPFTLRYGCLRCIPRLRRCHAPDSHAGITRAFDVIGLTGRDRGFHPLSLALAAGSPGAGWLMQDAITYILTMNRSLSCCFSRYCGSYAQGANWWRILSSVARSSPVSCALNLTSSAACLAVSFLR